MERPDDIRRKIALYREYLAEGTSGERAVSYLRELKRLEVELDEIDRDGDKRQ